MGATHGRKAQILMATGSGVTFTNEAMTDAGDHQNYTIANSAKRYWDPTASFTVQQGNDEIQTVTVDATGGTFTLTFGANTTIAIAYNAAASAVQSALAALASIGSGNVAVTGSNGGPYTVRFQASLGLTNQAQLTADSSSLTGNSHTATPATVQNGANYATISSGFTIQYVGGKVIYNSAQVLGTQVRVSGKYKVYAAMVGARSWAPDIERDEKENTAMTTNSTPTIWRTFQMGLVQGVFKLSMWHADDTYFELLDDDSLHMIASLVFDVTSALPRLECEVLMKKETISAMLNELETEDIDFRINGPIYLVTS